MQKSRIGPLLRTIAARFLIALATGWMLMYPSEYLFWSVLPKDYDAAAFFMTLLAYSLLGRVLFCVLQFCRVDTLSGLLLAGAIYGWTAEGVVVGTMYDDFPINLIWTGVAWHGLISVVMIWYCLRKTALWPWTRYAAAIVAAGILFGTWAAFWPHERPEFPSALGVLAQGLLASLGFVCAQIVYDRAPATAFTVTRTEAAILALLVLAVFGTQIAARPSPIVAVYPLLAGLALTMLALNRNAGTGPPHIVERLADARASPARRAALVALPAVIAASFAATRWMAPALPTNEVYYWATILIGTAAYLLASWRSLRRILSSARA